MQTRASSPEWNALAETALAQAGLFTAAQAAMAGYSAQLLAHHARAGRFERLRRGIYRITHFPAGDHDDLILAWLWTGREGVVSHQTALALGNLSDVLPSEIHLTLPVPWRRRRLRVPEGTRLHFGDVGSTERTWVGAVPVTTTARTLEDCAANNLAPNLLLQAAEQALHRGLVTRDEIPTVIATLRDFGGLP
ncbi:MAG: type IV toxin-antitoxin system AbiEi family antitoxin domain-containing protein [Planctomycetes bacterium]|nr:type IV toxin-antitoxin system AbiEi family antitoxin domain-containing protein [Planctomycetota bacterium]